MSVGHIQYVSDASHLNLCPETNLTRPLTTKAPQTNKRVH